MMQSGSYTERVELGCYLTGSNDTINFNHVIVSINNNKNNIKLYWKPMLTKEVATNICLSSHYKHNIKVYQTKMREGLCDVAVRWNEKYKRKYKWRVFAICVDNAALPVCQFPKKEITKKINLLFFLGFFTLLYIKQWMYAYFLYADIILQWCLFSEVILCNFRTFLGPLAQAQLNNSYYINRLIKTCRLHDLPKMPTVATANSMAYM